MPSPRTRVAGRFRRTTRSVVILALVAAALVGVACGSSGRDLRDYPAGQTAPPRNAPAAGTIQDGSTTTTSDVFTLSTDEWTPGGSIPARFTCDGDDISPGLVISSPPDGTVELALVATDLDADGLVHWIVAGIPTDTTAIPAGSVPAGAVQAMVANAEVGWFGPCPPAGETHTYELTLHALGAPSGVVEGQSAESAVPAIDAVSAARSSLTTTYRR